jgi:hypothetical protein
MNILLFLFFALSAYFLPGYAVVNLVETKGIGRLAKCLLAVPISLVFVPFSLAVIGNLFPFIPSLWQVLLLALLIWVLGELLRRSQRRPSVNFRERNQDLESPRRLEWLLASIFILGFSLIINLPRLEMFVHADQGVYLPSWDEFRHLTVLTSVARSGIPPRNYVFPDLSLVYYYWSQIYPAAIANSGFVAFSLARAFAFHAFIQTAAFLGLVYGFLRANAHSWLSRVSGMGFFTIFAGFDYFVTMSGIEWWQKHVPWLVSDNEIFSLPLLYFFAPQHLAGGMAFVMALWLWNNIRANAWIRCTVLGVLLAFTFGTSPFVFLGFGIAVILWIVEYRRLFKSRRMILPAIAFGLPFAAGWIPQMILTMSSSGKIVWNQFRVPFLETYLSIETSWSGMLDKFLTLFYLPVVMFWIFLIEIGLPFVFYAVWVFLKSWRQRLVWNRLAVLYPLVMFVVMEFLTDQNGGGNFSRRGFIPMQIVIALSAAFLFKNWKKPAREGNPIRRRIPFAKMSFLSLVLGYFVFVFASAQSVTWFSFVQPASAQAIGCAFQIKKNIVVAGLTLASCPEMPEEFRYILWMNNHTPTNALIVENPAPDLADHRFRLLERIRYLDPIDANHLHDFRIELEITRPQDLAALTLETSGKDILWQVLHSEYFISRHPPVYYVTRKGVDSEWGAPVYEDSYVAIFRIPENYLSTP